MPSYRSRTARSSLYWLAAAFMFGGVPILVYFNSPGASVLNLILGIVAGSVLLGMFLWDLLSVSVIRLDAGRSKVYYTRGVPHFRKTEEFDYSEVRAVDVRKTTLSSRGGSSTWFEIRVLLHAGRTLVIQKPTAIRAFKRGEELARALGVEVDSGCRANLGL